MSRLNSIYGLTILTLLPPSPLQVCIWAWANMRGWWSCAVATWIEHVPPYVAHYDGRGLYHAAPYPSLGPLICGTLAPAVDGYRYTFDYHACHIGQGCRASPSYLLVLAVVFAPATSDIRPSSPSALPCP